MLLAKKVSLIETINLNDEMSEGKPNKATVCWNIIQAYLRTHDYIRRGDVWKLCGVSGGTANQILIDFVKGGEVNQVSQKKLLGI